MKNFIITGFIYCTITLGIIYLFMSFYAYDGMAKCQETHSYETCFNSINN